MAVDGAAGGDPALGRAWIGGLRLSAEDAPVLLPPPPPSPQRGLSLGLPQSLRDPVLIPAPTPAVRLAPWTGSQTSKASSRSFSCSKTRSRLTQPRNASCRMYPSFRVWGDRATSASPGEEGVESLVPRLFLLRQERTSANNEGLEFLGPFPSREGDTFCWCLALGS